MTDVAPGSLIGGYRIEEAAGRGGMGVVYRATQIALGRTVAVKLIAPELAHDEQFRERFKRESRLAASIDHPNVIPVYEAGETDGALFIAMRWVDGTDLDRLIRRDGGLEPARAARIVAQVAAALDAAHDRGLVHRDVKPANVLVAAGRAEHVYLTDFGLVKRSKAATGVTGSGQFVGTLDYIAPEQIEGKPDACSDIYSLGCVLFHALTGRVPFERDSEVAKISAHLHDPPPRPSALGPRVLNPFDEVVARAMAKEQSQRYRTAGDLGQAALDAAEESSALRGEATRGARTAVLSRPGDARRREPRRWRLGLGVVALVVAGAAAAAILLSGQHGGGSASHARPKRASVTADGSLLKARGEPGVYLIQAGARFAISPRERALFFAGERRKLRVVSPATLHRVPLVPRDGSTVRALHNTVAWVIRDGHREPTLHPAPDFVRIPETGLRQIRLRPGGHPTTVTLRYHRTVVSGRNFRIAARARSRAGTPRGVCAFFRVRPHSLLERAAMEARRGRCVAVLNVKHLHHVRYAVHFHGYPGWRGRSVATKRITVLPRGSIVPG